jgi:hypothetical protein
MQTCGKILNTRFLILKLFFTSLVHYMFRPIWSSSSGDSKIAVQIKLLDVNTSFHARRWARIENKWRAADAALPLLNKAKNSEFAQIRYTF